MADNEDLYKYCPRIRKLWNEIKIKIGITDKILKSDMELQGYAYRQLNYLRPNT